MGIHLLVPKSNAAHGSFAMVEVRRLSLPSRETIPLMLTRAEIRQSAVPKPSFGKSPAYFWSKNVIATKVVVVINKVNVFLLQMNPESDRLSATMANR